MKIFISRNRALFAVFEGTLLCRNGFAWNKRTQGRQLRLLNEAIGSDAQKHKTA